MEITTATRGFTLIELLLYVSLLSLILLASTFFSGTLLEARVQKPSDQ